MNAPNNSLFKNQMVVGTKREKVTKTVEEGLKVHSRYLKIRSPTRRIEMTHSQRRTKRTAKRR